MATGRADFTYNSEVDVVAQSLVALAASITLIAQTVGVYLQPDWSALQGIDKQFTVSGALMAAGAVVNGNWVVPAGKTWYIVGGSMTIRANLAADSDNNQIGNVYLQGGDPLGVMDNLGSIGGNGGGQLVISKPEVIAAGKTFRISMRNAANHVCNMSGFAWGYEV